MSAAETSQQRILDTVRERCEPDPDGIQHEESNCWTSIERLRFDASKESGKMPAGEVRDAVTALADDHHLITWHGLVAPATDAHLTALIENEQRCAFPRRSLIAKINKIRQSQGGGSA